MTNFTSFLAAVPQALDKVLDYFWPNSNAFHLTRADFRKIQKKFKLINSQAPNGLFKIKMRSGKRASN